MKILVITSCTGKKASKPDNQLVLSDFQQGQEHLKQREKELADYFLPAEKLYTGEQHIRLMHGIEALRQTDIKIELVPDDFNAPLPQAILADFYPQTD